MSNGDARVSFFDELDSHKSPLRQAKRNQEERQNDNIRQHTARQFLVTIDGSKNNEWEEKEELKSSKSKYHMIPKEVALEMKTEKPDHGFAFS
jgi:hypothetical protein